MATTQTPTRAPLARHEARTDALTAATRTAACDVAHRVRAALHDAETALDDVLGGWTVFPIRFRLPGDVPELVREATLLRQARQQVDIRSTSPEDPTSLTLRHRPTPAGVEGR